MSEENTPQDAEGTTLLYCSPRQALGQKDIRQIKDALEEEGFKLVPSEDGNNVMIKRDKGSSAVDLKEALES